MILNKKCTTISAPAKYFDPSKNVHHPPKFLVQLSFCVYSNLILLSQISVASSENPQRKGVSAESRKQSERGGNPDLLSVFRYLVFRRICGRKLEHFPQPVHYFPLREKVEKSASLKSKANLSLGNFLLSIFTQFSCLIYQTSQTNSSSSKLFSLRYNT